MIYKVGDRVRIVRCDYDPSWVGAEVVILGPPGWARGYPRNYLVSPPPGCDPLKEYGAPPEYLAPLTPPAADTWAADAVRKVTKPQHVEPEIRPCLAPADELDEARALERAFRELGFWQPDY